jgi:nitrite reductase/ring-hydroxylating ferredoxin subunit
MNAEPGYLRVARLSDIPEGKGTRVTIGDDEISLWHLRGRVYAIGNVCSHQHFSALHKGILSGLNVTCPMHGWTYSLETGMALSGGGRVRTYAVKLEGDDIYIQRSAGGSAWTR